MKKLKVTDQISIQRFLESEDVAIACSIDCRAVFTRFNREQYDDLIDRMIEFKKDFFGSKEKAD